MTTEAPATEQKQTKGWLNRQAESEAKKDIVSMSERSGSVFPLLGGLILIVFFALHQAWSTGFFTEAFGTVEAFLLYAPLVFFMFTIVTRMVLGRKNAVRPFDAAFLALVALATIGLYAVFPFDFSHLADVLPGSLQFVLTWVTSDIARVVMILQILGSGFFAVYTVLLYVNVKRILKLQK